MSVSSLHQRCGIAIHKSLSLAQILVQAICQYKDEWQSHLVAWGKLERIWCLDYDELAESPPEKEERSERRELYDTLSGNPRRGSSDRVPLHRESVCDGIEPGSFLLSGAT
jgi:hypothetical protein